MFEKFSENVKDFQENLFEGLGKNFKETFGKNLKNFRGTLDKFLENFG